MFSHLQSSPVAERLGKPLTDLALVLHDACEGLEINAVLAIDGLWQDMYHTDRGRGGSNDGAVDAFVDTARGLVDLVFEVVRQRMSPRQAMDRNK